MRVMKLTHRQQRFVDEYLLDLNATQACIRAGYSEKTASRIGPELLGKTCVKAALALELEKRANRTRVDADWVLKRLAAMADADMADLYGEDGILKPVKDWPDVWRRGLVAGVETLEERDREGNVIGQVRKVKLADRMRSMELIGRHVDVGAWRDKLDVTVTDTRSERLARARERAGK